MGGKKEKRKKDGENERKEIKEREKGELKKGIYQSIKEVNGHLGRKMSQDVSWDRKLFW